MLDVITLGAATRDVFLVSRDFQIINSPKFVGGQAECVALGHKIDVEQIYFSTGGGATNAATTFGNLGFQTGIVTRVGKDDAGAAVMHDLGQANVQLGQVKIIPKATTAYSTLLTTTSGERSVLVYRGASSSFENTDIAWKNLNSSWLYISSLAGNVNLLRKIIAHAKKHGLRVALNPGNGELKHAADIRELIPSLSVLLVNKEEAQLLLGTNEAEVPKLLHQLAAPDVHVIITDGHRGTHAYLNGQIWFARTTGAKSISRAGAGDAFGSGTVAGLMKGWPLDEALRLGTLNAESVIQKFGAKAGILTKWPKKNQLAKVTVRALR